MARIISTRSVPDPRVAIAAVLASDFRSERYAIAPGNWADDDAPEIPPERDAEWRRRRAELEAWFEARRDEIELETLRVWGAEEFADLLNADEQAYCERTEHGYRLLFGDDDPDRRKTLWFPAA